MLSTVKWEAFYINTADPKLSGKTDLVPAIFPVAPAVLGILCCKPEHKEPEDISNAS